jgi:hypothetical protein
MVGGGRDVRLGLCMGLGRAEFLDQISVVRLKMEDVANVVKLEYAMLAF